MSSRKNRKFIKDPKNMDNLMSDFLGRHGFSQQLNAAMVVTAAREWFRSNLEDILQEDVHVISFVDSTIKIAIKNAPAGYVLQNYHEALKDFLLQKFPVLEIKMITHKIDPKVFENQVQ